MGGDKTSNEVELSGKHAFGVTLRSSAGQAATPQVVGASNDYYDAVGGVS